MIIRPRAFVLLGNIFLLARSSLVGFWVLLGLHDEVLTGQPYEHPVRVKFMAVILIAISASFQFRVGKLDLSRYGIGYD